MKRLFGVENLQTILNYSYDEEIKSLEECIDDDLPIGLGPAIKFCEDNGYTNHIAYNLMILKQELKNKI